MEHAPPLPPANVSSSRTVSEIAPVIASLVAPPNTLQSAHHFVSLKITAKNYLFWRTQLVPFLRGQNLLGYVTGDFPCPTAFLVSGDAVTSVPNPGHAAWVQQDQSILSMLISSLSEETMHLAVRHSTSRSVWDVIETAFGSSTCARSLSLLSQLQSLRQGDMSIAEYLGRAKVVVEELALAGQPVSLDEQNLYVFRGLRPEFKAMVSSLATKGAPVTLDQLSDYLTAQSFICADDFAASDSVPAALVAQRASGRGGHRGGRSGRRRGQRAGSVRGQRGGQGSFAPKC